MPAAARSHDRAFVVDLTKSNESWPLRTKVRRGLWNLVWAVLFRHTPKRRGNGFRLFLLRLFGAQIDGEPLVHPTCRILLPWELEIGRYSAVGEQVEIYNYGRVVIGPMSVVSQYSYLCTGSHDYTHPYMPLTWKPITIGPECWVAAGVFIGPGVVVHEGAVVGACSVVTRDVPRWTVNAGNPCRVLKPRIMQRIDGSESAADG